MSKPAAAPKGRRRVAKKKTALLDSDSDDAPAKITLPP